MTRRTNGRGGSGFLGLLSDGEIVRHAKVAEAPDSQRFKKWTGNGLYLVTWPNGPTALVEAATPTGATWNRRLVKMYRTGCSGRRGPVSRGR